MNSSGACARTSRIRRSTRSRARLARVIDVAWHELPRLSQEPADAARRSRVRRSGLRTAVEWLEARDHILEAQRRYDDPGARSRILLIAGAARHDQTCPGEMSKTFRLVELARTVDRSGRLRVRSARPQPADGAVRPAHPAVQGVRLDGHAVVPLALLVLPESCARTDRRLDERDLPALGRGARHHDRHAGLLVPGPECPEVDDRPAGLCRRRQPGSDDDTRQEAGRGQGDSN